MQAFEIEDVSGNVHIAGEIISVVLMKRLR